MGKNEDIKDIFQLRPRKLKKIDRSRVVDDKNLFQAPVATEVTTPPRAYEVDVGHVAEFGKLKEGMKLEPGETRIAEINVDHFPAEAILKLMENGAPDGLNSRLGVEFPKLELHSDSYYIEKKMEIPTIEKLNYKKLIGISLLKSDHDKLSTTGNLYLTDYGMERYEKYEDQIERIKAKIDPGNFHSIEELQKLVERNPKAYKALTGSEKHFLLHVYTPPDLKKLVFALEIRNAIGHGLYGKVFEILIADYKEKCGGNYDLYKEGIQQVLEIAVEKKYLSTDQKNRLLENPDFNLKNNNQAWDELSDDQKEMRKGIKDRISDWVWVDPQGAKNDENNNEVEQSCNARGVRKRKLPCVFHLDGDNDKKVNIDDPEFEKRVKKIDSHDLVEYLKDKTPVERNKILKIVDGAGPEKVHGSFKEKVKDLVKKLKSDVHNAKVREIEKIVKTDEIVKILIDDIEKNPQNTIFDKTKLSHSEYRKSVSKAQKSSAGDVADSASKQFGRMGKAVLAKDLVSGVLRGDGKSLAIMTGMVVGDKMLEVTGKFVGKELAIAGANKMSKVAASAALGVSKTGTKMAGKFLNGASKVVGPFAGTITSGYSIFSLVNNIKDFKSGNKDAIADIVGDSISIGSSVATVSTQILMAFSVITGPAGPILIAISVGVDIIASLTTGIYKAVKAVENIDKLIKLDGSEKFDQGLRAFFGQEASPYLKKLMAEKKANVELIGNMLEFLANNSQYKRYVSSARALHFYNCTWEAHWWTGWCYPRGYKHLKNATRCKSEVCNETLELVLDNHVDFSKKQFIYLERSRPDQPKSGHVFCTNGRVEYLEKYSEKEPTYEYYCRGALGVEIHQNNNNNNQTLYDLGIGSDFAIGFPNYVNVFNVNDGVKNFTGGEKDDIFHIQAENSLSGYLDGGGGLNSLILGSSIPGNLTVNLMGKFLKCSSNINVKFEKIPNVTGRQVIPTEIHITTITTVVDLTVNLMGLFLNGSNINVKFEKIQKVIGRQGISDEILGSCDTLYIDGQGGSDIITLNDLLCYPSNPDHHLTVKLYANDHLENLSNFGKFVYIISNTKNGSNVTLGGAYFRLNPYVNHTILFEKQVKDINYMNLDSNHILNIDGTKIELNSTLKYMRGFPRIFTMTGSSGKIEAEIKLTEAGEIHVIHNLNENSGSRTGFSGATNIFNLNEGYWDVVGASHDIFNLNGENFKGGNIIGSSSGKNILSVSQNYHQDKTVFIDMVRGQFSAGWLHKIPLSLENVQIIQGRTGKPDTIIPGCSTLYIDGLGGNTIHYDEIHLNENNCTEMPETTINVGNLTMVTGYSRGSYTYLISYKAHYHHLNLSLKSQTIHKIMLTFPLKIIQNFQVNNEKNQIKFSLHSGQNFDYTFYSTELVKSKEEFNSKINQENIGSCSNLKKVVGETQGLIQFNTMLNEQIEFTYQINEKKEINLIHHLTNELNSEMSQIIRGNSTYPNIFNCKSGNWTISPSGDGNDIFLIESMDFNGHIKGLNSSLVIQFISYSLVKK